MKEIDYITEYIRSGENDGKRLGLELEHFVMDSLGRSVSFDMLSGMIEKVAERLGADIAVIDGRVMGYSLEEYCVSVEPSCQLEISISPYEDLFKIRNIYDSFRDVWTEVLAEEGFYLVENGIDPRVETGEMAPADLPLIPKKRYHYMDRYFLETGKYGRHMMRASASTQVSIDYISEKDLVRKLRVLEKISPFLMLMMENKSEKDSFLDDDKKVHLLRTQVWDDLDPDRTGFLAGSLDKDYSYVKYAEDILSKPLVVYTDKGETTYAGSKSIMEMGGLSEHLVEHLISMFFFHIRIKKYLEVRVADSVPIDKAIAYAALIKGILYDDDCLEEAEELLSDIRCIDDINEIINNIECDGIKAVCMDGISVGKMCIKIAHISAKGLTEDERGLLKELVPIPDFHAIAG